MTASSHLRKALEAATPRPWRVTCARGTHPDGTVCIGAAEEPALGGLPKYLRPEEATLITLLVNAGGAIADLIDAVERVGHTCHFRSHLACNACDLTEPYDQVRAALGETTGEAGDG